MVISKKRVIFINAHWNTLIMKTPMTYLFNIKPPQKYSILFKELIKEPSIQVCSLVTSEGSSIPRSVRFPLKKLVARIESWYVFRKNGFTKKDILTLTNLSDIQSDDVVLAFIHTRGGADLVDKIDCKKLLHLNQYSGHSIEELNKSLPYVQDYLLEADTAKEGNYLLKATLAQNFRFHILPYIVGERFIRKKSFIEREKKAVATGTIAKLLNETDYTKHYGIPYLHKMRKVIFDNKDNLDGFVEVLISPYVETSSKKVEKEYKGFFNVIYSFYKLMFLKPGSQKSYFSFDIVEKYNDYQMAVVPEEIIGIPAIGAFEAMSCGCAFIGIDHAMYRDIGMIPNIHYVSYDGTIDDLKNKISYYQSYQKELEQIANNGYDFIRKTCSKRNVMKIFTHLIDELDYDV